MSRKISLRFVLYFLAFYMTLALASTIVFIFFMAKVLVDFNAYSHIREADIDTMQKHIVKDSEGNLTFSKELIQIAEDSGGVLQLLDKDGKVIKSTTMNREIPSAYQFTDFIKMSNEHNSFIWLLKDDKSLLFTSETASDLLMQNLMDSEGFPRITEKQKKALENYNAYFELYDVDGRILSTTKVKNRNSLNGMEMLELSQNLSEQQEIKTATVLNDGTTAVVRMPNPHYAPFNSSMINFLKRLSIGLVIFHGILLLFIIGFSFWIGQRFGRPVFYFMNKIKKLSEKDYSLVEDRKLRNSKNGRLKKKYRMYEAVDQSLITLAENLEENELKIKKTEQLREDWITGLSHDLKTPLSSIYGYSVMLSSNHEWTNEEVQKFASIMQHKASYMDELINDLTYTYQLKNNGVLLEREQIDLREYIEGYAGRIDAKAISFPAIGVPVYVTIDPKRFGRVLDNVIGNAVKHNPENTPVHISISLEGDSVVLNVRDEGEGMSPETVDNLFDRYYRGTNTTSGNTGTGLGLTIAKQLVEAHGGGIYVKSNNQGTTIMIRLPLVVDMRIK